MTHVEVNSSTNINDILYFSGLIDNRITFQNHSRPEGDGMANGRKTICVTLYLETKSLKTVQAKYCKRFDFSNFPHKFQITCCVKKFKDTGTLIKSTKKEVINNWQKGDCKIAREYPRSSRFCCLESEKVTLATLSRVRSFLFVHSQNLKE